jgi:hypothetical protein
MSSRDDRIVQNEALFREMNERMAEWPERQAAPATERHLFFCECGDRACQERVLLTIAEYAAIRATPVRFVVLPGHVWAEAERVVEKHAGYVVVEKGERFRYTVEQAGERWAKQSSSDGRTQKRRA